MTQQLYDSIETSIRKYEITKCAREERIILCHQCHGVATVWIRFTFWITTRGACALHYNANDYDLRTMLSTSRPASKTDF